MSAPSLFLTSRRVYGILAWTAAGNVLFLATTWLLAEYDQHYPGGYLQSSTPPFAKAGYLLLLTGNLAAENTIATWYSSMLLFLVALICLVCFLSDQTPGQGWPERLLSFGWLGLSGIFVVLSFDEIGSFHENIGDNTAFREVSGGYGWILFYVLIGVVGLYIAWFSIARLRRYPLACVSLISGTLLFLSNPFQEAVEISAFQAAADPLHWKRPIFLLLLEEGSELFASWCFICAALLYAAQGGRSGSLSGGLPQLTLNIPIPFSSRNGRLVLLLAVCGLGALLLAFPDNPADTVTGNPRNWFPSIVAGWISLWCGYQLLARTGCRCENALLALGSAGLSAFYGSGIYGFALFWRISNGAALGKLLLLGLLLGLTCRLWSLQPGKLNRAGVCLAALSLAAAVLLGRASTVEYAFFGLALLALWLVPSPRPHLGGVWPVPLPPASSSHLTTPDAWFQASEGAPNRPGHP